MVSPHADILRNLAVLDSFEIFQKENLNPKLAVYQNRYLVIYCKRPTTTMEAILHLFQHIMNDLLLFLGVLSINPTHIQSLQKDVRLFCFQKAVDAKLTVEERLQHATHLLLESQKQCNELIQTYKDMDYKILQTRLFFEKEIKRLNVDRELLMKKYSVDPQDFENYKNFMAKQAAQSSSNKEE